MAVYFWTESEEFQTHDIDVVMPVPAQLAAWLEDVGFVRAPDGRHWTLGDSDVFVEAPGSELDADALVREIELPSGRSAKVLSRVDILLHRLEEFEATGHEVVAKQALVLLAGLTAQEQQDLERRAPAHRVAAVLEALREIERRLLAGGRQPESDELHRIARAAQRADYPQGQS